MFEIQPIPFLIVLHHAVCLVGHFMIWNTNRAVVLEYCKILVSFEFGSGLTNLYDWLRRFDIEQLDCACCIDCIELAALYFASRLGIRMWKVWKSKYHIISRQSVLVKGVFNVLSVSLLYLYRGFCGFAKVTPWLKQGFYATTVVLSYSG